MTQDENKDVNITAAKPILKAALWVIQQRKIMAEKELEDIEVKPLEAINAFNEIDKLIADLTNYINNIGE